LWAPQFATHWIHEKNSIAPTEVTFTSSCRTFTVLVLSTDQVRSRNESLFSLQASPQKAVDSSVIDLTLDAVKVSGLFRSHFRGSWARTWPLQRSRPRGARVTALHEGGEDKSKFFDLFRILDSLNGTRSETDIIACPKSSSKWNSVRLCLCLCLYVADSVRIDGSAQKKPMDMGDGTCALTNEGIKPTPLYSSKPWSGR